MSRRKVVSDNDLVPSEWSDGEEETVEQWGTRQYNCGLRTGRAEGINIAKQHLLDAAAAEFLRDGPNASLIKKLAQDLTLPKETDDD